MKYSVCENENLSSISEKFGVSVFSLMISNPKINNIEYLSIGEILNIPIIDGKIINYNKPYTYEVMVEDIYKLKNNYPFIDVNIIGKSVLGKNIYAIFLGLGKNNIQFNASHHANEWITTPIQMNFIEEFAKHIIKDEYYYGFDVCDIYIRSTISIIPMVNPDGVNLVIKGLTDENIEYHKKLREWNGGSTNFENWNANIRGVDINHNYDAGWYIYKYDIEPKIEIFGPAPKRYSGEYPESEPETKAMVNFTNSINFSQVFAFHTQGEIIYWDYMNKASFESLSIAKKYSKISGYQIAGIAPGPASVGGYKDWFIEKYNRPGFTVELGNGQNPLPISHFEDIYIKSVKILLLASYLSVNKSIDNL